MLRTTFGGELSIYVNGVLYAPHGMNGTLEAIRADSGARIWASDWTVPNPPAFHNGTLFAGSYGALYAIDTLDHTIKWKHEVEGSSYFSPVVAYGSVYFVSGDDRISAVDEETGELRWTIQTGAFSSGTHPIVADGRVYFSGPHTHAFDTTTGEMSWEVPVAATGGSSPLVVEGRLLVATFDGLTALSSTTGEHEWTYKTRKYARGAPAYWNGIVYAISDDDMLHAVDVATGTGKWRVPFNAGWGASPTVSDGKLYIGDAGGMLQVRDLETGRLLARKEVGGMIVGSPVVVGDVVFLRVQRVVDFMPADMLVAVVAPEERALIPDVHPVGFVLFVGLLLQARRWTRSGCESKPEACDLHAAFSGSNSRR